MEFYTVKFELQETVKAASVMEAVQKFKDNFDWSDLKYGTYKVTFLFTDEEEMS